jgi:membrane-associated phospholipid phosphatase
MKRRSFLLAAAAASAATARAQTAAPVVPALANSPYAAAHAGLFCKTLPHDAEGKVSPQVLKDVGAALSSRNVAAIEALPITNEYRFVSPLASATWASWKYASQVQMPAAPPAWDSQALAEQALELYWMSLLRDERLSTIERSSLAREAAAELGGTQTFRGISAQLLGRDLGTFMPATKHGHAISQLLWLPIPYGAHTIWQSYKMPFKDQAFLTKWNEWLDVQNGKWHPGILQHHSELHYLRTGRDLAEYVRWDFSYQAFINAANIIMGDPHRPRAALNAALPYKTARTQNGFATLGAAEVLAMIARAADMALKAAWHVKWDQHALLRPEEYGGLVEKSAMPAAQKLRDTQALKRVKEKYGSYLLPQAYPEGAPGHPAFPSGHATIAGACATVMKAFFDPELKFRFPVQPTSDGRDRESYDGPATNVRTEIDKLAANIAIGRQWAGIHWQCDSTGGLALGEEVGLAVLKEAFDQYAEAKSGWFKGFKVTRFDGRVANVS